MTPIRNQIIRKLIVGFGNIFDNIKLIRYLPDGTEQQRIEVPIVFAPKEKYVSRLLGDENLDKKVQITLPRFSYNIIGMTYDPTRKQITSRKNVYLSDNSNTMFSQQVPVPYNFEFELYLYVRNIEDGTQLVEYILPFFTPEYTIKLNLVPSMGIVKEVPVLLNSVDYSIEYEGERDSDTRVIIWTLKFTVKSYIYGQISERNVIKQTLVSLNNLTGLTQEDTISLNMSSSGNGRYKDGEQVYQGYSYDTAAGTARVVSYSNTTNQLKVTNVHGSLQTNTFVYGLTSHAEYILNSFDISNTRYALANTIVVPGSANATSYFTSVTTITEP
jgi:hypothetical protein